VVQKHVSAQAQPLTMPKIDSQVEPRTVRCELPLVLHFPFPHMKRRC
jgi:hypothetical protein